MLIMHTDGGEPPARYRTVGTEHGPCSIQPDVTVPPTVLVTALDNGTLVLQGRPDGPRTYLNPADAVLLRRELAAAFGRTEAGSRDQQDNLR